MIVGNIKDLDAKEIVHPAAKDSKMKVLISEQEGWDDYVMRVVEVAEDGYSPLHNHDWPHINYMIEGTGEVLIGEQTYPVSSGSYSFVPANETHQYRNTGKGIFKFVCIVPKNGHY